MVTKQYTPPVLIVKEKIEVYQTVGAVATVILKELTAPVNRKVIPYNDTKCYYEPYYHQMIKNNIRKNYSNIIFQMIISNMLVVHADCLILLPYSSISAKLKSVATQRKNASEYLKNPVTVLL